MTEQSTFIRGASVPDPDVAESSYAAARRSTPTPAALPRRARASTTAPTDFAQLGLRASLCAVLDDQGYRHPTPIQAQAIAPVLAGRDVIGCAQTGTGKTAAFALPILQRLAASAGRKPTIRALVLTPTRELALQVDDSFETYGSRLDLYHTVVFGGVKAGAQIRELRRGVDLLVATPGRLLDLMEQREVSFDDLEVLVLDEADRMLDMGFVRDVRRIVRALPTERQTLLFSATMPPTIVELARTMLSDPVRIEVARESTTVDEVDQHVCFVEEADKRALLVDVLRDRDVEHALVFARTKHRANRVASYLAQAGVGCAAIHGNKSQAARERALGDFRAKRIRVLIATDIAARGIDVEGISHVVNFDLPNEPETYVHRIGRTARAGARGTALSFCGEQETSYLADIERLIGLRIDRLEGHAHRPRFTLPGATELGVRRSQRSGAPAHTGPSGASVARGVPRSATPGTSGRTAAASRRRRPRPGGSGRRAGMRRP